MKKQTTEDLLSVAHQEYMEKIRELHERLDMRIGYNFHIPNQLDNFMPPSNSSSSNINELQFGTIDKVSSVVSMLKGTLERKKLGNEIQKEGIEAIEDGSLGYYSNVNHVNEIQNYEVQRGFEDLANGEMKDPGLFQIVQGGMDADMDNFVAPTNTNHVQMSFASREASQSESSAPVISNGCDGQTPTACESSSKQTGIAKKLRYTGTNVR